MSEGAGVERLLAFVDRLRESGEREEEEPEALEDWVAFQVGGRVCALPVERVREVIRVGTITRVAGAPYPVRGALNLRGRVLAVLDLGERLGLGRVESGRDARILVVDLDGRWVGLLVDAAERLVQIAPSEVRPASPDLLPAGGEAVRGELPWAEDRLILLHAESLLSTTEENA